MTYIATAGPTPSALITPFSPECPLAGAVAAQLLGPTTPVAFASSVFTSASRARLFPFVLAQTFTPAAVFAFNGVVVSGNLDIGIYTEGFSRVWSSGSTAQAGTSTKQAIAYTGPALAPGRYFMAVVLDNATGTLMGLVPGTLLAAQLMSGLGYAAQAAAFALPATVVPVAAGSLGTADAYVPMVGLSARAAP